MLNENFPNWLRDVYERLLTETTDAAYKRVPIKPFTSCTVNEIINNKLDDLLGNRKDLNMSAKTALKSYFENLKYLPRSKTNVRFHALPCDSDKLDPEVDHFHHGNFIRFLTKEYLSFLSEVQDELTEAFPEFTNDWTILQSARHIVSEEQDILDLTTETQRQKRNLPFRLASTDIDQISIFFEVVFQDIANPKFRKEELFFVKKEGSTGPSAFLSDTHSYEYYNEKDKFGTFKAKQLRYFVDNIVSIESMISNCELSDLFKEHSLLFLSRVVHRYQYDIFNKSREAVTLQSFLAGKPNLAPLALEKCATETLNKLGIQQIKRMKALRDRWAYGYESGPANYPNQVIKVWRTCYKESFPKVFKYGDQDFINNIIMSSFNRLSSKYGKVSIVNCDATGFDRTLPLEFNASFYNHISNYDKLLATLLAVICVSPIAVGSLGKVNGKSYNNYLIGDPLDPNSWFYGLGKSGDPDVDFRAKLACSFVLVRVITKILNKEFNTSNIQACLNHELDISFLNLGDNNLIIIPDQYIDVFKKELEKDTVIRLELEDNCKFGGHYYAINNEGNLTSILSPISFVGKLLSSEYSYSSSKHYGWPEGILMRYELAEEEALLYNNNTNKRCLEIIEQAFSKISNKSLKELAQEYLPIFQARTETDSKLFNILSASNSSYKDKLRARELLLDPEKIRWKFELQDFTEEQAYIIKDVLMNEVDQVTKDFILEKINY